MAQTIQIEPYSTDDWEILELHAGYFEDQLLNQVGVVHCDQVLAVWVQQRTLVRLRVTGTDPEAPCVRLGVDTEVHVAPKVRQLGAQETKEKSHDTPPPPRRAFLRLVCEAWIRPAGKTSSSANVVYVNPNSLPVMSEWSSDQLVEVSTVVLGSPTDNEDTSTEQVMRSIGILKLDDTLPLDIITANPLMWRQLGLTTSQRVRVKQVEHKASPASTVRFERIPDVAARKQNKQDSQDINLATKALCDWLSAHTYDIPLLLTHNMIIECPYPERNEQLTVRVQIVDNAEGNAMDAPDPQQIAYAFLDKNAAKTAVCCDATTTDGLQRNVPKEPRPLGGMEDLLKEGNVFLRSALASPVLEKSLGTFVNGGLLICGRAGSGKTLLLEHLKKSTSQDPGWLLNWTFVDCRQLSEERPTVVSDQLRFYFDQAAWHAPSVVCMDNLDRLLPAELEHADATRTRQLTERFLEIAHHMQQHHRLVVVATSEQTTSLHPLLLNSHLFKCTLQIPAPDKILRSKILNAIMSSGSPTAKAALPSIDTREVANQTEGYVAADLVTLVEHAVRQAVIRTIASGGKSVQLTMDDFTTAINDYTPSALRGVKLAESTVAWSDIGGLRDARRTLLETLEWPTKYAKIFANCPLRLRSGLLLYGFPGCGKTLLASAVAKECGLNFISVKGPELLNKYIGASEKSVRDLFERAKAARPSILFFDEFDSIAPRRGHDSTGVTDRVVNQLLTEMDGAEKLEGVYVLAATSRPDLIDPALLRPGRLDKSILCGMPDVEERREILEAVARKLHIDPSVDLAEVARECEGYTGADLQALLYNAHLDAAHELIDGTVTNNTSSNQVDAGELDFLTFNVANLTAAERGQLSRRLEQIHAAQTSKPRTDQQSTTKQTTNNVSYIQRRHIENALKTTRSSLTPQEYRRLANIYREFVQGRSADMPDGTGTHGIGQRSTLG